MTESSGGLKPPRQLVKKFNLNPAALQKPGDFKRKFLPNRGSSNGIE